MSIEYEFEYLTIDRKGVAHAPPQHAGYDEPFFGGRILGKITLHDDDHDLETVSERELYAKCLLEDPDLSRSGKMFAPGIVLQMFGISAVQYEEMIGNFRSAIYKGDHGTMPRILRNPNDKLIHQTSRSPAVSLAIATVLVPGLQDEFDFLALEESLAPGTHLGQWWSGLWKHLFTVESKIMSDRATEIAENGFARADQIFRFDWAHSDLGKICYEPIEDEEGVTTGFQRANIRHTLSLPDTIARPPLKYLTIRIVNLISLEDISPGCGPETDPQVPQAQIRSFDRRFAPVNFFKSFTIDVSYLESVQIANINDDDLLKKLKHMIEVDMNLYFGFDQLELAWSNPVTFWGEHDALVRIRKTEELCRVLEELRMHQLLHEGDRTLFLYLMKHGMDGLVGNKRHPRWPSTYCVEVAPSTSKDKPKRKANLLGEEPMPTHSPRKRKLNGRLG